MCTKMVQGRDQVFNSGQREHVLKVSGKIIKRVALVNSGTLMATFTRASG